MTGVVTGPDGLDLRMTWPERQLEVKRRHYQRGAYALAEAELPDLPDFIRLCGGKMPDSYHSLLYREYAKRVEATYNKVYRGARIDHAVAELMLNSAVRWAYHVEWWEYEGRRIYALDPTTAHALLMTNIDPFPTDELRLPVQSFFLRVPREMQWKFELGKMVRQADMGFDSQGNPIPGLSVPLEEHPEPVQELDGFHVTADMSLAKLNRLQIVICGRSARAPEGDHLMWVELDMRHPTLGEVMDQNLKPTPRAVALMAGGSPEGSPLDRRFLQIILGTLLYITSSHPELKPIEPPSRSTMAKAVKDDKKRGRYLNRSRYVITYVGGPRSGFRSSAGDPDGEGTTRKPPKPHVRQGHFTTIWIGPRDSAERRSERRWIQPIMVGSWDRIAAYEAQKNLKIVIHKTRPAQAVGKVD